WDAYGNIATGYAGTVHFSSSDGQAVLPADATLSNGTGAFSATLKTAGTHGRTASDTVSASVTGTQSGITVNPAAASTLSVAAFPSPVTAGTVGGFTVSAQDAYGNVATGYAGTVHFSSSDGQAMLPADATLSNGSGAFSAALETAGSQSLTVTDTLMSSLSGGQSGITINAAAADHLRIDAPPAAAANAPFTVTVAALDPFGNTATSYRGTIRFTSSDMAPGV